MVEQFQNGVPVDNTIIIAKELRNNFESLNSVLERLTPFVIKSSTTALGESAGTEILLKGGTIYNATNQPTLLPDYKVDLRQLVEYRSLYLSTHDDPAYVTGSVDTLAYNVPLYRKATLVFDTLDINNPYKLLQGEDITITITNFNSIGNILTFTTPYPDPILVELPQPGGTVVEVTPILQYFKITQSGYTYAINSVTYVNKQVAGPLFEHRVTLVDSTDPNNPARITNTALTDITLNPPSNGGAVFIHANAFDSLDINNLPAPVLRDGDIGIAQITMILQGQDNTTGRIIMESVPTSSVIDVRPLLRSGAVTFNTGGMLTYIGSPNISSSTPSYTSQSIYSTIPEDNPLSGQSSILGLPAYSNKVYPDSNLNGTGLTNRIANLGALMADKAQDKIIMFTDGGTFTWSINTPGAGEGTLSWSQDIKVNIPGSSQVGPTNVTTTISSGSIVFPDNAGSPLYGACAYITIDRNADATIAPGSIVVTDRLDVPVRENVFILARRGISADEVYLPDSTRLTNGDTAKIGVGVSSGVPSIALTSAHILVGNGFNIATDVPMSNEASITNTGAVTLLNSAVLGKTLVGGYAAAAGTLAAGNSIQTAISKLDGNDTLRVLKAGDSMTGSLSISQGTTTASLVATQTTQGNPVIVHRSTGTKTATETICQGYVQTTNNTVAQVFAIGTANDTVHRISADILAHRPATGGATACTIYGTFKNIAGTVTQVGTTTTTGLDDGITVSDPGSFAVAGSGISINVQGGVLKTIDWTTTVRIMQTT